MKKAAILFVSLLLALHVNSYAAEAQTYLKSLVGKTIDISGLYDDYGFVGDLVSANFKKGTVLRIKGFIQEKKTSKDLWATLAKRSDAKIVQNPVSGSKAIMIDAAFDIGGGVLIAPYDSFDKDTDYFVTQLKNVNSEDIGPKAFILQRANEEKFDILVRDATENNKFKDFLKELAL